MSEVAIANIREKLFMGATCYIDCEDDMEALLAHIDKLEAENARLREAGEACEENLRLVHDAAGPMRKDAPMPRYSTFEAWKMMADALDYPTHDATSALQPEGE